MSKTNPEEYEDFQKTQKSFLKAEGDHVTYISIYNRWRKKNYSEMYVDLKKNLTLIDGAMIISSTSDH